MIRLGRPPNHPELLAYAVVLVGAFVLRLVGLETKPMHHDESIHAWFTWRLVTGEGYAYDPAYHGPVQFYLYSIASLVAGAGEAAVRAVPALLGSVLTVLPWLLREQLGRAAALVAATLLAISPSFLYFSRFAREDMAVAALTLGLIVVTFRMLDRPTRWQPPVLLGLLAASFATKETTYISVFVAGAFFALALAAQALGARRSGRPFATVPLVAAVRATGARAWAWGLTSFALVFTLLFSSFLLNPQGLRDGLYDSLSYWLSQHEVGRGDQPWFYYLVVLPAYELPIVLLGLIGVATTFRKPTLLGLFLVWNVLVSLVVYSWAGERMPWLVVHPMLPLVLLAGIGAAAVWHSRRSLVRRAGLVAAPVAALVLAHGAAAVAYRHPADPAELLVFTQTSTDVLPVRDWLLELDRNVLRRTGEHPTIVVDGWGGTAWPWVWYLRDLPVAYPDLSAPVSPDGWDVVVVAEPNAERVRPLLRSFERHRFLLREWWVVDWHAAGPAELWRWFRSREAWSPKGSIAEEVYVRRTLLEEVAWPPEPGSG